MNYEPCLLVGFIPVNDTSVVDDHMSYAISVADPENPLGVTVCGVF